MSYEHVLTLEPEFGLEETIDFKTLITTMESGKEKRRAKWTYGLRRYRLKLFAHTKTNMDTIWDFFIARKGAFDPFLVLIPTEFEVSGEVIDNGNGAQTDFVLDEFPVNTTGGTFTMSVDGSSVTATLSNNFTTEFSYVSYAVAPGGGLPLTGSYQFYFYVRFMADRMTRELLAYQLLNAGVELMEVRWDEYRPRAGNTNLIKGTTFDNITIVESVSAYKFRAVSESESISIAESITTHPSILHLSVLDAVSVGESQTYYSWYESFDSVSIAESVTVTIT